MITSLKSNISSLRVLRTLDKLGGAMNRTAERLASGQRINHAADDAAGLAVAGALHVDSRVYAQGARNIGDGLSYLTVAGGAVDELKNILLRQRELATQSANGTVSGTQRLAMDAEVQALADEYNRILGSTKFNGQAVFAEDDGALVVQGGYGAAGAIRTEMAVSQSTMPTQAVSVTETGAIGNDQGASAAISGDGRIVVFTSAATDLVSGDNNGQWDVFCRDLLTGETMRVNAGLNGAESNAGASNPAISADGRYIMFASSATNLVQGDTNGFSDIFVYDRVLETTELVSRASDGALGNNSSTGAGGAISADGRYVIFHSSASNLVSGDNNGVSDLFRHDRLTGVTERVNVATNGTEANATANAAVSSDDGRFIAFYSGATNLVGGDANGAASDIFVRDMASGTTERVNISTSGVQATTHCFAPSISSDGRYVAFETVSTNLVPGDTALNDIFIRDRLTGTTQRATLTESGAAPDSGCYGEKFALSGDGRYLAFTTSAGNMIAGDNNFVSDVYVRDLVTGAVRRASAGPTGAEGNNFSRDAMLSRDGQFVTYASRATNFMGGDTNGGNDIFVSATGFAAPRFVAPALTWISVARRDEALSSQARIDSYMEELNLVSGRIGAGMNRLASAREVLGAAMETSRSAESRIIDADVAEEAGNYTRQRILQQAATAIMAQANQQPALALRLLAE